MTDRPAPSPSDAAGTYAPRPTGTTATATEPTTTPDRTRTVAIVVFDGVEELDAVGPWEALGMWAAHAASRPTRVVALSPDGQAVRCAHGMRIAVDGGLHEARAIDVLVHPGGPGTRTLQTDDRHLERMRGLHEGGTLVTSVCTGSHVLAAAGLLRRRPATTHHHALDELRELDPSTDVLAGPRFVDDGDVVTSAGVSAGIDMALHLVGRLESAEAAELVRDAMQYEAPARR